jgi:ABC-type uncharacterized transport system ATPase component
LVKGKRLTLREKEIIEQFKMQINKEERIFLIGYMGAGKPLLVSNWLNGWNISSLTWTM